MQSITPPYKNKKQSKKRKWQNLKKTNQNSKFSITVKQDQSKIVELQKIIYKQSNIHIPIIYWNDSVFMRVSIQAYNTESDINKMFDMLEYFNLL